MVAFLYAYVFPIINFIMLIWLLVYFGKKPFFLYGKDKKASYEQMSSYSKQKYEDAKKQNTETLEKLKNLDLQLRSIEDRWKADAIEEEQKLAFSTQQTIKALQEESIRVCEQHKNKAIKEIKSQIWQLAQKEIVNSVKQQRQNKQDVVGKFSVWQSKSSLLHHDHSGEII